MSQLVVMSFAFSRGEPPEANLVFDMRFLRNPHWQDHLRPLSGRDEAVGAYIAGDAAYADALARLEALLLTLLPLYQTDENIPVRVAFGCTGGRHRSVHVAEEVARRLRAAGFSPNVAHRDLAMAPHESLEGTPENGAGQLVSGG